MEDRAGQKAVNELAKQFRSGQPGIRDLSVLLPGRSLGRGVRRRHESNPGFSTRQWWGLSGGITKILLCEGLGLNEGKSVKRPGSCLIPDRSSINGCYWYY